MLCFCIAIFLNGGKSTKKSEEKGEILCKPRAHHELTEVPWETGWKSMKAVMKTACRGIYSNIKLLLVQFSGCVSTQYYTTVYDM